VPSDLAHLVLVHTRNVPLGPVARIETRRRRTTLHDNAGVSLAEVLADEVSAQSLGTSTAVSRWDEFEVELTGGNSKLLRAADKRLRDAGLRPAGRSTKLERSLPVTLPAPRSHGRLTAGSTAGEVVLGYLAAARPARQVMPAAVARSCRRVSRPRAGRRQDGSPSG
jgi:hypothetical protein